MHWLSTQVSFGIRVPVSDSAPPWSYTHDDDGAMVIILIVLETRIKPKSMKHAQYLGC